MSNFTCPAFSFYSDENSCIILCLVTLLSAILALEGFSSPQLPVSSMKFRLCILHPRGCQVKGSLSLGPCGNCFGNEQPNSLAKATAT